MVRIRRLLGPALFAWPLWLSAQGAPDFARVLDRLDQLERENRQLTEKVQSLQARLDAVEGSKAPASLALRCDSFMTGWEVMEKSRTDVEQQMKEEGWTFFFVAGEMEATSFRFDAEKALATGLKRLGEMTKALHCNSFEISHVTHQIFLGISRVCVACHARNLQQGFLLLGK